MQTNVPSIDAFPFPVATSVAVFREFMDQNDYVASWLQARDVYEVTARFLVALALQEAKHRSMPGSSIPDEVRIAVLALLGKSPAFGDWVSILEQLVRGLRFFKPESGHPPVFTGFYEMLFRRTGRKNDPPNDVLIALKEAVTWRNNEIGHGALGRGAGFLEKTVSRRRREIDQFLCMLTPMTTIQLVATGANFNVDLTGPTLPPVLRSGAGIQIEAVSSTDPTQRMPLAPLIHVADLDIDGSVIPGIVLFEKRIRTKGIKKIDSYLDYHFGRRVHLSQNWGDLDLEGNSPMERETLWAKSQHLLDSGQKSYSATLLQAISALRLGFDDNTEIVERGALHEIQRALNGQDRGIVFVFGGAGTGKSWLAASLQRRNLVGLRAYSTLLFHLGIGAAQSARVFTSSLTAQARERLDCVGCMLAPVSAPESANEAMLQFLEAALNISVGGEIVIVIDGLDEVSDDTNETVTPLDYLPIPGDLPLGVHLVLTSRPVDVCSCTAKEAILRLQSGARQVGVPVTEIKLHQSSREQHSIVCTIVEKKMSNQPPELQSKIIAASQGNLLRSAHLCALVNSAGQDALRAVGGGLTVLYDTYLDWLRSRIGQRIFDQLHSPLLATLAVARSSISFDALADILETDKERVFVASLDLRDFLLTVRSTTGGPPELTVLHDELRQYVRGRHDLFSHAHRRLAHWSKQEMSTDPDSFYARQFLGFHLVCAGELGLLRDAIQNDLTVIDHDGHGIVIPRLLYGLQGAERYVDMHIKRERLASLELLLGRIEEDVRLAGKRGAKALRSLKIMRIQTAMTVCDSYAHSDPTRAIDHLERAHALLRDQQEDEETMTLAAVSLYKLYEAYIWLGRDADAKAVLQSSLDIRRILLEKGTHKFENASAVVWCICGLLRIKQENDNHIVKQMGLLEEAESAMNYAKTLASQQQVLETARLEGIFSVTSAGFASSLEEKECWLSRAVAAYRTACLSSVNDRYLDYALASSLGQLSRIQLRLNRISESELALCEAELILGELLAYESSGNPHYERLDAHQRALRALLAAHNGNSEEAAERMADALSCLRKASTVIRTGMILEEIEMFEQDLQKLQQHGSTQ